MTLPKSCDVVEDDEINNKMHFKPVLMPQITPWWSWRAKISELAGLRESWQQIWPIATTAKIELFVSRRNNCLKSEPKSDHKLHVCY